MTDWCLDWHYEKQGRLLTFAVVSERLIWLFPWAGSRTLLPFSASVGGEGRHKWRPCLFLGARNGLQYDVWPIRTQGGREIVHSREPCAHRHTHTCMDVCTDASKCTCVCTSTPHLHTQGCILGWPNPEAQFQWMIFLFCFCLFSSAS